MNGRTLILMVVAIMVAVVTVIVVKNRSGGDSSVKVLVAVADIPAGGFVRADKDMSWSDWSQSNITPALITSDTHHIEEFNGAVARHSISTGVPITTTDIMRANEGGFMSAVLTPGMRAVSIAVSLTSGNAGFIFPGDKVDLLLTHKIPVKDSGDNVLASETFIENTRVLAIDQMLDNPENKAVVAKTITLEVTPKQAEMINVATSLGTISVSLRSLATTNKQDAAAVPAKEAPAAVKDGVAKPADATAPVVTPAATAVATPVAPATVTTTATSPATSGAPTVSSTVTVPPSGNYSTDNDVSKLMGDRNAVRSKVSVYHGSTSEQIDFHQGGK